jgi:pyruvate ferredoxin oxidoreductase beta subunit
VAHNIEYAATASIGFPNDYITKVRRALEVEGPAVVHVLAPCPLGWRSDPVNTIKIAKLAVQTTIFPIYEVEKGKYKLNINMRNPIAAEEYLKLQGRFSHLFRPEFKEELETIKQSIKERWAKVLTMCGESS